jgi:hypothetical protein
MGINNMKELKDLYNGDYSNEDFKFNELVGKVFKDIYLNSDADNEFILFKVSDTEIYQMYHWYECCENVYIDDINGDIADLIGSEILHFEKRTNEGQNDEVSETWTFYDIQTKKGSVNIKWHGESNGCYSESVYFIKLNLD